MDWSYKHIAPPEQEPRYRHVAPPEQKQRYRHVAPPEQKQRLTPLDSVFLSAYSPEYAVVVAL